MKVVIVDDSIFAQKNIIRLLSDEFKFIEFTCADDGEKGFECCKEYRPDYVFVDLLMPKMNGKELIEAIKESGIETKIIVVSADVQVAVRDEIESIGIYQFINKPFNREKARELAKLMRGGVNDAQ